MEAYPHEKLWNQRVELVDMLEAKETRYQKQKYLIRTWKRTLICLSMNVPGPIKVTKDIDWAFEKGREKIKEQMKLHNIEILNESIEYKKTGFEWYVSVDENAREVKKWMIEVEEASPLGRVFDIDVFHYSGDKIGRIDICMAPRTCMLCNNVAHACSRNRTHSVEEVVGYIHQMIQDERGKSCGS